MRHGASLVLPGVIVAVMVTISACTHTPATRGPVAAKPAAVLSGERPRVPNEYLVTLAPDVNDDVISTYYGRFGIKYLHALEDETFLVILANDPGPQKMEALIQGDSRIKFVQPNLIYWGYR